jgi:hypothetical protein
LVYWVHLLPKHVQANKYLHVCTTTFLSTRRLAETLLLRDLEGDKNK